MLLVGLDFRTFAGEVGQSDPELGVAAPDAAVLGLLEDVLNGHGELVPLASHVAARHRGQNSCATHTRTERLVSRAL